MVYWALGGQENVQDRWPARLETRYNSETPLEVARQQFDNIAVMDFFPATIYSPRTKFWPVIDDALQGEGAAASLGPTPAPPWRATRPAWPPPPALTPLSTSRWRSSPSRPTPATSPSHSAAKTTIST